MCFKTFRRILSTDIFTAQSSLPNSQVLHNPRRNIIFLDRSCLSHTVLLSLMKRDEDSFLYLNKLTDLQAWNFDQVIATNDLWRLGTASILFQCFVSVNFKSFLLPTHIYFFRHSISTAPKTLPITRCFEIYYLQSLHEYIPQPFRDPKISYLRIISLNS